MDAEDAAVGIFEQRGILLAPHDVLVNGARLVSGQKLRFGFLAVNFHGKFVDLRASRHGEKIGALERLAIRVVKFLVYARRADLAVDLHVDVVVAHLQRRVGKRRHDGRDGPIDNDEAIRAREAGKVEHDCGGGQQGEGFHAPTLARNQPANVRRLRKICKKVVRRLGENVL